MRNFNSQQLVDDYGSQKNLLILTDGIYVE